MHAHFPESPVAPIVVGLGEVLWDVFPEGKLPGGAPANVAYEAQQLGCQGIVASRVGRDELGDELLEFLKSKGLQTDFIQRDESAPTGYVTVSINEQNQPEYVIHEGVAWDCLEMTPEWKNIMQSAQAVCFGTLAQRTAQSRVAIHQALQATSEECLRVYDVNIRQHYYDVQWMNTSLELASVVKLNDEEVARLAPLLELSSDLSQFSRELLTRHKLKLVCVTRGAAGCLVTSPLEQIDVPSRPVQVADTVGAGDAFTAGLIYSQLMKMSLKKSAEFANRIGGIVASKPGAMPEVKDEFANVVSNS